MNHRCLVKGNSLQDMKQVMHHQTSLLILLATIIFSSALDTIINCIKNRFN
jgi:hypothetical protein